MTVSELIERLCECDPNMDGMNHCVDEVDVVIKLGPCDNDCAVVQLS